MILRILLSLILTQMLQISYAQTNRSFRIVHTIDKGDYFYIPQSALTDTVEGVLYQEKILQKTNYHARPVKFYWISNCNDGYYNLTITPEQIFFSSSHDNPNPNFLFWAININPEQYKQIRTGLAKTRPNGFENISKNYRHSMVVYFDKFKDTFAIPEEWTDSIMHQFELHCNEEIKTKLSQYLSLINSYIDNKTTKVAFPGEDETKTNSRKYFSSSKEEMRSWRPVKFDPPKMLKDE